MRNYKIAPSLVCANPLNMSGDIQELINSEVELIHFDVMDGSFVPRYGLYPELLSALRSRTNIAVDVHMMVDNAEEYIDVFQNAGATFYNVHLESTNHIHRVIKKIQKSGMKAGVAINPGTPIEELRWIISEIEMVCLMAINPGIVGHKFIPEMINKISALRSFANQYGNSNLIIEIDGGVTFETAPLMIEAGADALVCGTGTIFRPHEDSIKNKISALRKKIDEKL